MRQYYISTLNTLVTRKLIFPFASVLLLINLLVCLPSAYAQSRHRNDLIEQIKRFFFGTRPGGIPTGRQRGGAVRDRCPNVAQQLTALVPATNKGIPFLESTISEHPAFWFYVPYFPASRRNAEFVLIDENEDDVYKTTFPLIQSSGIVSLKLPKTLPPLQERKQYHWVLSVFCNPDNRSADATVNGWVERIPVSPTLSNQLQTATDKERVLVYVKQELWYETLTTLAQLQRNNPLDGELKVTWQDLLQTMGLADNVPKFWSNYPLPNQAKNSGGK